MLITTKAIYQTIYIFYVPGNYFLSSLKEKNPHLIKQNRIHRNEETFVLQHPLFFSKYKNNKHKLTIWEIYRYLIKLFLLLC